MSKLWAWEFILSCLKLAIGLCLIVVDWLGQEKETDIELLRNKTLEIDSALISEGICVPSSKRLLVLSLILVEGEQEEEVERVEVVAEDAEVMIEIGVVGVVVVVDILSVTDLEISIVAIDWLVWL